MANSIIDTKNISFKYGDDYAIEDISFHVDQGDYVGLIGPNGSGKTTLVKILLGLLKPQKGTVELFGQESSKFIDRYKIGYVAQKSHQKDQEIPISVEEVVLEGRVPRRGIGKSFTKSDFEKAHSALKHVSMLANKERKIAELSGGQRQRVLIARALAADAQLLVLDEPTVGIDATSQEEFYALLSELNKKHNITIILVSHDIDVITNEVSIIACINKTLVYHGEPKKFVKKDMMEQLYGKGRKFVDHNHTH